AESLARSSVQTPTATLPIKVAQPKKLPSPFNGFPSRILLPVNDITIIGGGFAGVEAAWAAATRGAKVILYEMRPVRMTAVHQTGDLAELVCSNSFKSNLLTSATGVLKEEMRRLGSVILPIAQKHRVPAGEALAVDREPF